MTKETIIQKIKEIINEYGPLSTAKVEADCSPVYNSMGKDNFALIEYFNQDTVGIVQYVNETVVDEFDVDYNDLSMDNLEEIYDLIKEYDENNYMVKSYDPND